MEFGKLADISNIDFTLPEDSSDTARVLAKYEKNDQPLLYIGCTGWSMPQWNGVWYPKDCKSTNYLKEYSRQFNTIEHNTTHYRIPDAALVLKWKNESSADFKFCPKIPQSISHSRDLGLNTTEMRLFTENILLLEEKMGCCFMQLPPHFGIERLALLESFLQKWSLQLPLAIEIRHENIFNDEKNSHRFFDLLEKHQVASVITDVSGRRDVLHQRLTNDIAMVRFVGNDLHQTDYERIDEWIERLKNWFSQGVQQVFFFTHEPENIKAPDLALYMTEQLKKTFESNVRSAQRYDNNKQEQMSLF
jgi:uncharacterized protein YecE (DUF72 family)